MERIINGMRCNTDKAQRVGITDNGKTPQEPGYWSQTLYRLSNGQYFTDTYGRIRRRGVTTAEVGHTLERISYKEALEWGDKYLSDEEYADAFGLPGDDAEDKRLTIMLSARHRAKLDAMRRDSGRSLRGLVEYMIDHTDISDM